MKRFATLSLTLVTASTVTAQSIKSRPLGAIQATTREALGAPTVARALPNGSVIINDIARRRLLLLDPTLQNYTVIADSTSGSVNGYGQRPGALIPYVADSTLFLDATAGSFLVIDPAGKVARVMSPPRPSDNFAIASTFNGFPSFDAKGRMIYRTSFPRTPMRTADGGIQMSPAPDSAPLIRVDLDTRRADTIGYLRTAKQIPQPITFPDGRTVQMMRTVPLPTIDDWAVLADGSVAFVRGQDYHIDWIKPDGSKASSGKIAFDWRRLDDDAKMSVIDSLQREATNARTAGGPPGTFTMGGDGVRIAQSGGGGGAPPAMVERMVVAGGAAVAAAAGGAGSGAITIPPPQPPSVNEIPDYMPVFTATSARPDADGNLWIRTTSGGTQPGHIVYDVINNQGTLVDRVEMPRAMSIIGFGKGVVYLSQREGYTVNVLKASIK